MKKSEMFYNAQAAVMRDTGLPTHEKVAIIVMLEEQKKVEVYWEEKKEKEEAEKAAHKEKEAK